MYSAGSQTITEDGKAVKVPLLQWSFTIANGNKGNMNVSNTLIDTEAIAKERAMSEFLKHSYKLREINLNTYRTDFKKNDVVKVRGLNYLVKGITTTVTSVAMVTTLRMVRYE